MAQTLKDAMKPDTQRSTSHGRGGAGNINSRPNNTIDAEGLRTPTIKTATYTTGRGGTGNMATNLPSNPEYARAAQDVEAPAASVQEKEARGTYHWGRGGEGNMMTVGKQGERSASKEKKERAGSKGAQEGEAQRRRGSFQAVVEKGKEMLGLGGGKKGQQQQSGDGSAIAEEAEEKK